MDGIRILTAGAGRSVFATPPSAPYYYACHRLHAGERFTLPELDIYAVHFVPHYPAHVTVTNGEAVLSPGDSWHAQGIVPSEWHTNGDAVVLVAGAKFAVTQAESYVTRAGEHYRVNKPWGHELWLNGEHPAFNLKEVFIKAGTQTSLQYHHFKEETNFLLTGDTTLVYKRTANVPNDDVTPDDLAEAPVPAGTALHIVPPTLHRLRAQTDIYLYEVATPFLDDVVRVSDDAGRSHGRIIAEHR